MEGINVIELSAPFDTKITKVRLYTQCAEIVRVCKFKVDAGQNQVHLSGLPNVLDSESLRVEGRGKATIHDVTLLLVDKTKKEATSAELTRLEERHQITKNALARCLASRKAVEEYLASINVQHVEPTGLTSIVENYDATAEGLDIKILALRKEVAELNAAIESEREVYDKLRKANNALRNRASVGVVAVESGEVQLSYDIRVNMQTNEKPITLRYKANIYQSTGESWDDVPVNLETISPSFGITVPTLTPWTVSVDRPSATAWSGRGGMGLGKGGGIRYRRIPQGNVDSDSDDDLFDEMDHINSYVESSGKLSETYHIAGLVSIPADGSERTFTIAEMNFDAAMSWISVPRIKNASEYTLLPGRASIYVDGSFISRTSLKGVNPEETFDCPLGVDPNVKVTYHHQIKQTTRTGFYNKTCVHLYTQRISIYNTKPATAMENVKILEQIPVSEDEQIGVKVISPPLSRAEGSVAVQDGVIARWDGGNPDSDDLDSKGTMGKDGRIVFACKVPAQGKITFMLQWEVSAPGTVEVRGL
ncbi:hypothetical protein BDZ89DRAFT_1091382 [Hymenopellis radicata]|nr:hypothetical protein BDZ89DRAFT_1091382 [Hymenopellis radicata]